MNTTSQNISITDAANRIYNVSHATPEQIKKVESLIHSGVLEAADKTKQTTTLTSVAIYLARKETARQEKSNKELQTTKGGVHRHESITNELYESIWSDYFLAVLMQRKLSHQSRFFAQAVVATQVLLLVLGLGTIGWATWSVMKTPLIPKEHVVIQKFLSQQFSEVTVTKITSNTSGGFLAEFSYKDNGRIIQSRLNLKIQGEQVTSFDSTE
jgi:hypothetical protein